jgi:predicted amidophosphoribosyltransferase
VRELILQTVDMASAHTSESRPSPGEIRANYAIDNTLTSPVPKTIGIFDDVLTTGAHFRAAADLLSETFPGVDITGVFVARRIIPEVNWEVEFGPPSH